MEKSSIEKFKENEKFFLRNASKIVDIDKFAGKTIVVINKKIDTLDNKLPELIDNTELNNRAYMQYIPPKNSVYPTHF